MHCSDKQRCKSTALQGWGDSATYWAPGRVYHMSELSCMLNVMKYVSVNTVPVRMQTEKWWQKQEGGMCSWRYGSVRSRGVQWASDSLGYGITFATVTFWPMESKLCFNSETTKTGTAAINYWATCGYKRGLSLAGCMASTTYYKYASLDISQCLKVILRERDIYKQFIILLTVYFKMHLTVLFIQLSMTAWQTWPTVL